MDIRNDPRSRILIAAVVTTMFCAVNIAALAGWIPSSMGYTGERAPSSHFRDAIAAGLHSPAAAELQGTQVKLANTVPQSGQPASQSH